jgi:hypothetical protein
VLKIHETILPSGDTRAVQLILSPGANVALVAGDETLALPEGAFAAVMRRFGGALEPGESLVAVASLDLGYGEVLRHVRHLARYDVIARDYLVYERRDEAEALCALATTVAGALEHLARARASAGERA